MSDPANSVSHLDLARSLGILEGKVDLIIQNQKDVLNASRERDEKVEALEKAQAEHSTYFKILAWVGGSFTALLASDYVISILRKLHILS